MLQSFIFVSFLLASASVTGLVAAFLADTISKCRRFTADPVLSRFIINVEAATFFVMWAALEALVACEVGPKIFD